MSAHLVRKGREEGSARVGRHRHGALPRRDRLAALILDECVAEPRGERPLGLLRSSFAPSRTAELGEVQICEGADAVPVHLPYERPNAGVRHGLAELPPPGIGVRKPLRSVGQVLAQVGEPEAGPNEAHILAGHLIEGGMVLNVVVVEAALIRAPGESWTEVVREGIGIGANGRSVVGSVRVEQVSQMVGATGADSQVADREAQHPRILPFCLEPGDVAVGRERDREGAVAHVVERGDERKHAEVRRRRAPPHRGVGRRTTRRIRGQRDDPALGRREEAVLRTEDGKIDQDLESLGLASGLQLEIPGPTALRSGPAVLEHDLEGTG